MCFNFCGYYISKPHPYLCPDAVRENPVLTLLCFLFHSWGGVGVDLLSDHHKAHCPPKVRSPELLPHPQEAAQVPRLWGPVQRAGKRVAEASCDSAPSFLPSPSSGPSFSPFSPSPLLLAFPSCLGALVFSLEMLAGQRKKDLE